MWKRGWIYYVCHGTNFSQLPTNNHQNHHDKSTISQIKFPCQVRLGRPPENHGSLRFGCPESLASASLKRVARKAIPLGKPFQLSNVFSFGMAANPPVPEKSLKHKLWKYWKSYINIEVELQLIQSRGGRSLGNPVNPEFNTPCWTTPPQNNPTNTPENQRCHQNLGIPRPTCPKEALLPRNRPTMAVSTPKLLGKNVQNFFWIKERSLIETFPKAHSMYICIYIHICIMLSMQHIV